MWLSRGGRCALALGLLIGCTAANQDGGEAADEAEFPTYTLEDDVDRYLNDRAYRRAVLEQGLLDHDLYYAQQRLQSYALEAGGWDALPERDRASTAFSIQNAAAAAEGSLSFDGAQATTLVPDELPGSQAEWVALGERVFFEYPVSTQPRLRTTLLSGQAEELGFITYEDNFVGVRVVEVEGQPRLASTCATCHASRLEGAPPSGQRSNRAFDLGGQVLHANAQGGSAAPAIDQTALENIALLGPGRSDVSDDGEFNPYAFPDWGGLADLPYLHHTANWFNVGVAPLAVRVETVYITGMRSEARIPRVLSWALAEYIRSLPPLPPLIESPEPERLERGRALFESSSCSSCHVPPLYTSERLVRVEEIGTDSAAALSPARGTGYYRIPSLRGVGRAAPYLHHGPFDTLEQMFDPSREEPGHRFGLELDKSERAELLYFLRSI